MYTSIYRPKNIDNFVGNRQLIQPFIRWLLEWDSNKYKCALVSGLCGIGKTLLVELILKKHDYNIINISSDNDRNKEYIKNVIKPLTSTKKTFDGQENVIVFNDIDSGGDYGFIGSLSELIKETKIPIICICDNRYDQSIKPIINLCFDIKMVKPTYKEIYVLMYNIVIKEKIRIKESEIKDLYDQANGDIRFMLNTLQFGLRKSKKNVQASNIFETTGKLLSIDEPLDSKYDIYWLSNDLHLLMVQENYINNTLGVSDQLRKIQNIAYSADALSDADLLETQVNMTNWELEPHVALSTINAASKCNKKNMIKFSQYLGKISTINKNRRDAIANMYNKKHQKQSVVKKVKGKVSEKVLEKEKKPRGRPKKAK